MKKTLIEMAILAGGCVFACGVIYITVQWVL